MDTSDNMSYLREVRIISLQFGQCDVLSSETGKGRCDGIAFKETTEQVKSPKCSNCDSDVVCLTVPILERDRRFLLDSGSGHDLISQRKVERMDLPTFACDEICFHTANGTTSANTQATIDMGTFTKKPKLMFCEILHQSCHLARDAWMRVIPSFGTPDLCHT